MLLNAAVLQEEDSHALEELLGFPLLKDGTRLGWLMNLNSVRRLHYPPCRSPLQALLMPLLSSSCTACEALALVHDVEVLGDGQW